VIFLEEGGRTKVFGGRRKDKGGRRIVLRYWPKMVILLLRAYLLPPSSFLLPPETFL
jgi:hypothetical protein